MDKDKKKKREKREKTKRLFQNSIGVTASAAVVVVATPLFDNVNADFINIKLLEDSIYYELEVIEEVAEDQMPNGYPLRLVIENQWERIEVDLEYGITSNVINDLRPNAEYSFKVEMDKGLTWVTLVSERMQTENELAGVIGNIDYVDSKLRNLAFNVFTQFGGVPIDFYFLEVYEDDLLITTLDVIEGEQTLTLDIPIKNSQYMFSLKGVSETGQLFELDERIFNPDAVFYHSFEIGLITLNEVLVRNALETSDFNPVYTLEISENIQPMEPITLDGSDITLALDANKTYVFNVFVTYDDPRTNETYISRIYQTEITMPDEIFYIINQIESTDGTRYLLNLENYDRLYLEAYIMIINPRTGRIYEEATFDRISDRFTSTLLEYELSGSLSSNQVLIIGVVLKDSDLKVPLYTVNP